MPESQSAFDIADRTRVDLADLIDRQMSPLGLLAMDALGHLEGQTVLDVGCGTGQTLLQLADRVGAAGRVLGIDIAPHSLSLARARTQIRPNISVVQDDAARAPLPVQRLDAIYSRFGVMFFAEPVQAFGNLLRALRPEGRIAFVCWRGVPENDLDAAPLQAAGLSFGEPPHASFASQPVINEVLQGAGFTRIAIRPFDVSVSCGGVEATLDVVTRVGALGKILRETPDLRGQSVPRVRAMLEERAIAGQVGLTAAVWVVTAWKS